MIGKPVRQSFTVKLCPVGRDCMDSREDRINITIANCLIGVDFTFSYISEYAYRYVYICLSINNMSTLMS